MIFTAQLIMTPERENPPVMDGQGRRWRSAPLTRYPAFPNLSTRAPAVLLKLKKRFFLTNTNRSSE